MPEFSARARSVVLSDVELARLDEVDDPTVHSERWVAPDRAAVPEHPRTSWNSVIAHCTVIALLAVPAMVLVALGIAAAAR